MKSTHNKAEQQVQKEIKYPCLMVAIDGEVVLFSAERKGTKVIANGNFEPVGYYYERWDMRFFTPLPPTESITLQND